MDEKEYLISMFIDDELDLDGKHEFVEKVHGDSRFKEDTIALLDQEKTLRTAVEDGRPLRTDLPRKRYAFFAPGPMKTAAAIMAAAAIILSAAFFLRQSPDGQGAVPYRFVIYEPDARQVELAGSFTGWKKIPLEARGGYWEVTLDLSPGEHRFTYILDGSLKVADPTVPSSESDDFGGENSILYTGYKA